MLQARFIEDVPATAEAAPGPERPARVRRMAFGLAHLPLIAAVLALSAGAWALSFLIRFDFAIPDPWQPVLWLPAVLLVQALCYHAHGVLRILWAYVGVRDALMVFRGALCATAILIAVNEAVLIAPRSVILLNGMVGPMAVCGLFLLLRFARETRLRAKSAESPVQKVLIVGAGDAGDGLLREIERGADLGVSVEGFIDDDPAKWGSKLRGIEVLEGTARLRRLAKRRGVHRILVALPSTDGSRIRQIVAPLLKSGLEVKVLPPKNRLNSGSALLPQLKDVAIEDLLRREPIRLDEDGISGLFGGKCVLVTGAAGSIGSELCRQILRYGPSKLVAVDWAETPLHDLMLELRSDGAGSGSRLVPELGDVTDFVRVRAVFAEHAPDIVLHAAALKHVPVCEDHPREAIRVNVGGTQTVARAALCAGTGLFVLISTDKAVNPTSVMGSTKRAAELIIHGLHREGGPTRFAAVRFGNVLGSNGSVLKIFRTQLAKGGPLTVTHPDMRRFFMTIPEAVQLVLQAAVQGDGGEIFEFDMGSPVRIVDLAEDFIRLSGLTPGRDVDITFTGVRPGEKLFEELYLHSETVEATSHPKIFRLKRPEGPGSDPAVRLCLDRLGPVDPSSDPDLSRLNRTFRRMLSEAPRESVGIR